MGLEQNCDRISKPRNDGLTDALVFCNRRMVLGVGNKVFALGQGKFGCRRNTSLKNVLGVSPCKLSAVPRVLPECRTCPFSDLCRKGESASCRQQHASPSCPVNCYS
eukprot:scaffold6164_cov163-Amphora_coffeaeformis.AAC.15